MEPPAMPQWIMALMVAPYFVVWAMWTGKVIADWIGFFHVNRRTREGFVNPLPTPEEHRQTVERVHPVDRITPRTWWALIGLSILWAVAVWVIGVVVFLVLPLNPMNEPGGSFTE